MGLSPLPLLMLASPYVDLRRFPASVTKEFVVGNLEILLRKLLQAFRGGY